MRVEIAAEPLEIAELLLLDVTERLAETEVGFRRSRLLLVEECRLVDQDEAMRADVVAIARRIVNRGRRVFVLANNKAEGSSPLTVTALARRLADACSPNFATS